MPELAGEGCRERLRRGGATQLAPNGVSPGAEEGIGVSLETDDTSRSKSERKEGNAHSQGCEREGRPPGKDMVGCEECAVCCGEDWVEDIESSRASGMEGT